MTTTYSIAEARNQFAALVRDAEVSNRPVYVTRRGQPVAVILSAEEYAHLLANQSERNFWKSYEEWRQMWTLPEFDLEPEAIWEDVRDHTAAPDKDPWK